MQEADAKAAVLYSYLKRLSGLKARRQLLYAHMTLRLNSLLTQRLSDGVISLNAEGEIVNYNTAAKPYLRLCLDLLPAVRLEIKQSKIWQDNQHCLIKRKSSSHSQGDPLEIWLCKNTTGFSLLLLSNKDEIRFVGEKPSINADISFSALIGTEVRSEIAALTEMLMTIQINETSGSMKLVQRLERLSQLLIFFEVLVDTSRAPEFIDDDRVSIQDLLSEILTEMRGSQGVCVLNHEQSDKVDKQGLVYGNREWLQVAFRALIESLNISAPLDSQIELRIRQNGSFLVITGGYSNLQDWERRRKAATNLTIDCRKDDIDRVLKVDASIRLTVAKQIIELHSGQLRIHVAGGDEKAGLIEGFTLLIPTGVPLRGRSPVTCTQCIFPQQARSLAKDLAQLLSRQPVPAYMSADELNMLAQLTAKPGH